jgi:ankyrin repeat protein
MPACDLFSAQGPNAFKVLREAWENLGVQTPFGNSFSCFLHAVTIWKARFVQELLNYGADADITDTRGRLPLHRAIFSMTVEEDAIVASLSEPTSVAIIARSTKDLDSQDETGRTPFQVAQEKKLYSTAEILIQYGAG